MMHHQKFKNRLNIRFLASLNRGEYEGNCSDTHVVHARPSEISSWGDSDSSEGMDLH